MQPGDERRRRPRRRCGDGARRSPPALRARDRASEPGSSATFVTGWKIAPSAAIPVAIPTCRNVLLMPGGHPGALHAAPSRPRSTRAARSRGRSRSPPSRKPGQERPSSPSDRRDAAHRATSRVAISARPAAEQRADRHARREPSRRSARRRTRAALSGRKRSAGLERRADRGCSACRASGRGTSRTSTTRSRTPSICAPTNAGPLEERQVDHRRPVASPARR